MLRPFLRRTVPWEPLNFNGRLLHFTSPLSETKGGFGKRGGKRSSWMRRRLGQKAGNLKRIIHCQLVHLCGHLTVFTRIHRTPELNFTVVLTDYSQHLLKLSPHLVCPRCSVHQGCLRKEGSKCSLSVLAFPAVSHSQCYWKKKFLLLLKDSLQLSIVSSLKASF